ncbi:flagellar export protein FliJ [Caldithrix abyssi]
MPRVNHFRLQKVLEFKEHLENMRTLELYKAQTQRARAEDELRALHSSKEALLQQTSQKYQSPSKLNLADLQIHLSYLGQLHDSIEHQNRSVEDLTKAVDRKRLELNEAVKERKIIQTLRDQFAERQKQQIKKAENEKIDEIALRQKSRNGELGE